MSYVQLTCLWKFHGQVFCAAKSSRKGESQNEKKDFKAEKESKCIQET